MTTSLRKGCIGLAIARRVKDARVTLGDVSPAALRVARQNVGSQRLSGRVKCLTIDVRQPAAPFLGTFDLIVSNPPFLFTNCQGAPLSAFTVVIQGNSSNCCIREGVP